MIYFNFPADQAHIEVSINDDRLISVLGPSYKWNDGFADIIDGMIQLTDIIRVNNAKALRALIIRDYINAKYLNLNVAPLYSPNPVLIVMTGNRTSDNAAAYEKLTEQLGYMPDIDGYTWHHSENISYFGGKCLCNMYLVESGYHRRHPHKGGVYLYELSTGRKYT